MTTMQIQRLRKKVNYQRACLLAMRHKAATCTDSKRWSTYMHKCKAIKKELKYNCGVLRLLLMLNDRGRGKVNTKGMRALAANVNLADCVIMDRYNGIKQHMYRKTVNGLYYNQAINGAIQYQWEPCPETHGYRYLYDER